MAGKMSKLGSLMKETREAQGLSYEKVTQDTRMSEDIIKQLEDGGFADLPSYNHAKNFVRNYAEYLGMDTDEVFNLLQDECTRENFTKEPQIVFSHEFPPKEELQETSATMKYILPVVVVALVIFAGTKLFLSVKGDKKAPESVAVEQQVPQQQAEPQAPAQEDTTFNTVDPKTVEKTIEEVNAAEEKAQADADAEVKPEDAAKTAETGTAETTDKDKKDEKTKENKAVKTGNLAVLNFADVCWVHVKSDTGEELDFIASRGSQKEISFKQYFILDVGNAAVASVNFNGKTIAGLGGYKQPAKGLKFEPNESGALKYTVVK